MPGGPIAPPFTAEPPYAAGPPVAAGQRGPTGPGDPALETEPRPNPVVLAGSSLWRLAVSICGFAGYFDSLNSQAPGAPLLIQMAEAGRFLSQIGSLVVGVFFLGLALYPLFVLGKRHEPERPWIRGQLTILMLLIAIPYNTIMGGPLDSTWELLEHAILPALVLVDWIFVGRNQGNAKWWYPMSWLAFPVVYLYNIVVYKAPNYDLFVPSRDDFSTMVFGALVGLIALGYALMGIASGVAALERKMLPPSSGR